MATTGYYGNYWLLWQLLVTMATACSSSSRIVSVSLSLHVSVTNFSNFRSTVCMYCKGMTFVSNNVHIKFDENNFKVSRRERHEIDRLIQSILYTLLYWLENVDCDCSLPQKNYVEMQITLGMVLNKLNVR